jgi:citrate lyase subunit gamma (acyl carrier protein)
MSEIVKTAQAGTLESADIMVMVSAAAPGSGIQIELVTPTLKQYGKQIKQTIENVLAANGITDAAVHANDKGALDYTIRARTQTAADRACGRGGN